MQSGRLIRNGEQAVCRWEEKFFLYTYKDTSYARISVKHVDKQRNFLWLPGVALRVIIALYILHLGTCGKYKIPAKMMFSHWY